MTTFKVTNSAYYAAFFGSIFSSVVILIALLNLGQFYVPRPIVGCIGLMFLGWSLFCLKKYRDYSFVLSRNEWCETNGSEVRVTQIKLVQKLSCRIIDSGKSRTILPVLQLVLADGSQMEYEVKEPVSVVHLAEWVSQNWPEAEISENVQKVLKWSEKAPWFFKSTWR